MRRSVLTIPQILRWLDAYRARTGRWPDGKSKERIEGTESTETWQNVNQALSCGLRGLPHGLSLAKLLSRYRDVRNRKALRPYTIHQILLWADRHQERTGAWPTARSGAVVDAPGETWC